MEILQDFYATHPFATAIIFLSLVSISLIKIMSFISKIAFSATVMIVAYYFFAMSPEQQQSFNESAKKILEPILGKIEKMNPPSVTKEVTDKVKNTYDDFIRED